MTGIIGAMDIEVNGLIGRMEDIKEEKISGTTYYSGKICGRECVVAKCGIGKVNAAIAAQTMILRYHPEMIINTGIAGSTGMNTHIGHVVIAEKVVQHDMDTTIIGDKPGELFLPEGESIVYIPCSSELISALEAACERVGEKNYITGIVATGDQFIGGRERRLALNSAFGSIACEMEGGSIGHVCYVNKVPFAILRSISDSFCDDAEAEYSTFSKAAAEKSVSILLAFLSE